MSRLRIDKGSFAGHETFPFRFTWLHKAIRAVEADPQAFSRADAMVDLGVGKNMVRSIRHWGLATGVIEEDPEVSNNRGRHLRVTELGEQLFGEDGWDPYLEDPATLWLLHWQLASTPEKATTWYWVFNHISQPEFSRKDLQRWLMEVVRENSWARASEASLKRDVDTFVRTYVPVRAGRQSIEDTLDCPLVDLGLIREFGQRGNYLLYRGPQPTLPDELVAYGLCEFLRGRDHDAQTLALDAIAFAPGSPGRVFCLSEDALLPRLERLSRITNGALVFDETAGLRQILIHKEPKPDKLLAKYYRESVRQMAAGGAA